MLNAYIRVHFTGNAKLNLPLLDPVVIPSIPISKTLQDIKVTGKLTNLTAKGATSITVKTFKFVHF